MRKQIAAANWKMNLTYQQGEKLFNDILSSGITLKPHQQVIFAIPFPYLIMGNSEVAADAGYDIAAQNCHEKLSGAFTGEISAEMLHSLGIHYCITGHSERREYFNENNQMLAEKVNRCLQFGITPIFCCGESLAVREKEEHFGFVEQQLRESLFHLAGEQLQEIIIAYEPVWAIGTGKTASTEQAQEMHAHIRSLIEQKYGSEISSKITVLYGGSVKASNAKELFSAPDVDGGLVGGASLVAGEFIQIIKALKDNHAE